MAGSRRMTDRTYLISTPLDERIFVGRPGRCPAGPVSLGNGGALRQPRLEALAGPAGQPPVQRQGRSDQEVDPAREGMGAPPAQPGESERQAADAGIDQMLAGAGPGDQLLDEGDGETGALPQRVAAEGP